MGLVEYTNKSISKTKIKFKKSMTNLKIGTKAQFDSPYSSKMG